MVMELDITPIDDQQTIGKLPSNLAKLLKSPFVLAQQDTKYSYRVISALDRLRFFADFAAQIRDLPDGTTISFKAEELRRA
jgi:hypothetical protein